MKRKGIIIGELLCVIISFIAFLIVPNHFEMRFNLSSDFHQATKWELFIMPVVFFLVELFLINIEKMYRENGPLSKFLFSKALSYIFPYLGVFINTYFILEIFEKNKIIHGHDILFKNLILLILLIFSVYDYLKNKNNRNLKIINILISLTSLLGLIIINIIPYTKIDLLFFVVISGLIIFSLITHIKINNIY